MNFFGETYPLEYMNRTIPFFSRLVGVTIFYPGNSLHWRNKPNIINHESPVRVTEYH